MPTLLLQPVRASAEIWRAALARDLPHLEIRIWPEIGNAADITYAAIGVLPEGRLARLPNLRLIASIFAGQDMLLSDQSLPDVPILRTDDPEGDAYLTECVLTHVLRHHRRLPEYAVQQHAKVWKRLPTKPARERHVGVMGLGSIGGAAAQVLAAHGFAVAGWTRRPRTLPGVVNHAGPEALAAFLSRTEILVNLLPLTPATHAILRRETLSLLPQGAALINLARGPHLVEADLLALLDEGHLSAATLDVFETEPLPADNPLWTHPRVTITPHAARELDVIAIAGRIARGIKRFEAGEIPGPLVDRAAGY